MSETPTSSAGETSTAEQSTPEFTAVTSQADLDKIVSARLARERSKYADYDDLKSRAAEYDKIQQASKTETQKAVERAETAEKALAAREAETERLRVIAKHQIPTDYQDLLTATDPETLEAQAEKIRKLITPAGPLVPTEGKQPATPSASADWLRDQFNKK